MKNDVQIKVLYMIDETGKKLDFEFNNKENKYLGSVNINDKGKASWDVVDLNYINNIMELVCYIMSDYNINRYHYETKDEDNERWNRACAYIYIHNLVINRRYNYVNNLENQASRSR